MKTKDLPLHIRARRKARRKVLLQKRQFLRTRFIENKVRKNILKPKYKQNIFHF